MSEDMLRMVFMGVKRLREDVERLGGTVSVKTSIILDLENIEALSPVGQVRVVDLDEAAREIAGDPARGEFMRRLAEAWLAADKDNKEILGAAWERVVNKDRLGRFMGG